MTAQIWFEDFVPGTVLRSPPRRITAEDIDRFAALSLSGGAAYALDCAHAMPDRVTAVGILGGAPPPDVPWPWPGWLPTSVRAARVVGCSRPSTRSLSANTLSASRPASSTRLAAM